MEIYIAIQKQKRNTISIGNLKTELKSLEGVEKIVDAEALSPVLGLRVQGAFDLSRVHQIICANKYSVLKTEILTKK